MTIFKLPASGDVSLDNDIVVAEDDFQRFVAAGSLIYTRGWAVEVRGDGGRGAVTYRKPRRTQANQWLRVANYFKKLKVDRADEGTSIQLACLVLAEHCAYEWSGDRGGPSDEMVSLAEHTIGMQVNDVVADLLSKETAL